jgi:hypothetical protein
MGRSKNVCCQVTELLQKGVKWKGSCTNSNPGTAGLSIMNQELRETACQRMTQDLDACCAFYEPKCASMWMCLYVSACISMYTYVYACIGMYMCMYVLK